MALLVIDMSNDFVGASAPTDFTMAREFVPKLRALADSCRTAGVLIIFFTVAWQADGSDMGRVADTFPTMVDAAGAPTVCVAGTVGVEICRDLAPQIEDFILEKQRFSCFTGTKLDELLHQRGIDTVVITGVAANGCCESTARDAVNRDYRVIYISDCNGTIDLPDLGWGSVSKEEVMRVLLTEMAFSTAEVTDSADLVRRVTT